MPVVTNFPHGAFLRKIKAAAVATSVAKRVLHPGHFMAAARLHRTRKRDKRVFDDAQLALVSEILPGGFLHFGYFDDPQTQPEDISLNDLLAAQLRYAELLIEQANNPSAPVLDVGCGMGALSAMLADRGYSPVALTPDRLQARHIESHYPHIPIIRCKFEDLPDPAAHAAKYGTVFTSESLQYLKLDRALPLLGDILAPGGRWIACDFFRINSSLAGGKAGHVWDAFRDRIHADGWRITHERDITPHILPTLRYIHMWGSRFGVPLLKFVLLKLRAKQPAIHYILEDVFQMLDGTIADNLQVIDPETFAQNKRYMLLVMEKGSG